MWKYMPRHMLAHAGICWRVVARPPKHCRHADWVKKLISKSNAYTNTPKSIQICMESIKMNWKSYDIMENSKENRGKYAKLYKIVETHKNTQHSHVIHENVTIWVAEKSSWWGLPSHMRYKSHGQKVCSPCSTTIFWSPGKSQFAVWADIIQGTDMSLYIKTSNFSEPACICWHMLAYYALPRYD